MNRFRWLLVLALVLALAVPAGAQGCGGMGGMGMGMDRGSGMSGMGGMGGMCGGMMGMGSCNMMQGCPMMIMPFLGYLDLSDAQLAEIDDLMAGFEERISEAREEAGMADPARAFLDLFSSSSFSVASLEDFTGRAADLSDEIRNIHEEALVSIHGVLTPGQLEQLQDLDLDQMGADMRGGCGMGGMNGMDGMRGMGRTGGGCRGMR